MIDSSTPSALSVSKREPAVSVCIAVRNCETYIAAAIESVLGQRYDDFEVVIVDNASTDGTVGIVQAIRDDRVRLRQAVQRAQNLTPRVTCTAAAYVRGI